MAGQILTSARVQEAEEWSEGRVGEGGIYRKGKGISLNRAVRAIIDLRWYVVNTGGDVRPFFPSPFLSLIPPPPSPLPSSPPSPSVFPPKFLLRSSFAFATGVPFTDLILIYNIHSPVVSLRSLSPTHTSPPPTHTHLLAALRTFSPVSGERHHCPLGINCGFSFDVRSSRSPLSYFSLFRPTTDVHHSLVLPLVSKSTGDAWNSNLSSTCGKKES